MTKTMNSLAVLLALLALAACSTAPHHKSVRVEDFSQGESVVAMVDAQAALEKATESLEQIVGEAQAAGELAVRYLSTDLYLKANDAAARGDLQTSVFLLEYVHRMNPEDFFLKKKLSIELIRTGQLEKAQELLAKVVENERDEVIELILGGVYTARHNIEAARQVYLNVLTKFPKNEEACIFLAKSYAEGNEVQKAHALLERCEKTIKAAIFPYYRGKMAIDSGNQSEAVAHFKRALKLDPEYYQATMGLGLIAESEERFEEAEKIYESFLERRPASYPVLHRLVQLLFAQEKYDKIIPYAEVLSAMDPSDINLKVRLGILYTDTQQYSNAISAFQAVLEVIPNSDKVLYYLGALFQQTRNFTEALHYYGQIESSSPLFHEGHLQMANILHAQAVEDSTQEKTFLSFIEEKGRLNQELGFDLVVLKATYHEQQENLDASIKALSSLKEQERFNEGHQYYLAALLEKNGQHQESLVMIQELLSKNPDHAHALNFLGYTMLERNEDLDQAYKYIKRAAELKPDDGYIRDSLGWYYYKTGHLEKALKEIQTAHELVQTDVIISKHLAIVYQELREYDMARKFFMEALNHCRFESERELVLEAMEQMENQRLPASASTPTVISP